MLTSAVFFFSVNHKIISTSDWLCCNEHLHLQRQRYPVSIVTLVTALPRHYRYPVQLQRARVSLFSHGLLFYIFEPLLESEIAMKTNIPQVFVLCVWRVSPWVPEGLLVGMVADDVKRGRIWIDTLPTFLQVNLSVITTWNDLKSTWMTSAARTCWFPLRSSPFHTYEYI